MFIVWGIVFPIYLFKRGRLIAAVRETEERDLYMTEAEQAEDDLQSGRSSSLARIALILSLTGFIPLIGSHALALIGMILGFVVVATRKPRRDLAISAIVIACFFFAVYTIVYATMLS